MDADDSVLHSLYQIYQPVHIQDVTTDQTVLVYSVQYHGDHNHGRMVHRRKVRDDDCGNAGNSVRALVHANAYARNIHGNAQEKFQTHDILATNENRENPE
jgi:DNA topoisomerase VI subunit B